MKPWVRNWVGILCHLPAVYFALFMLGIVWISSGPEKVVDGFSLLFILVFIVHMGIVAISLGLLVFFLIWLVRASDLSVEEKVLWGVGCFFIGPVVQPLLYWLHLRHVPDGPYFFGKALS